MAIDNNSPDLEADELVKQQIDTWRAGGQPDAESFLELHPNLRDYHKLVLDLAYEEYCLRSDAGEQVELNTFCDRFPTVKKSLRTLLTTHAVVHPSLNDLYDELDSIPWPETETAFLGFFLVRELGRGAFARVYLATEPSLGDRLVVVKVSRRGGGEAETLGRLTHRNIVPVFSVQEDPETQLTGICMPYLGSGTLLKALHAAEEKEGAARDANLFVEIGNCDTIKDAIPEDQTQPDLVLKDSSFVDGVVHIMAQVADALAYTHEAGICHRDLKPSNILLSPAGRPLLLDFNLSTDKRQQQTLVGGTLPYMPPEQLHRVLIEHAQDPDLGDPRSDVFSLGVIFYQMLTGHLPFGDIDPFEPSGIAAFRILARQEEGFKSLRSYDPEIEPHVEEIVETCLQLEPHKRFQSAAELASALHTSLSKSARFKRWIHRRRFLLSAAALGAGAMAGVAGYKFATRPPYAVRQYQAGIIAYENGEWNEAISCFDRAAEAQPSAFQPLVARGQARVAKGEYDLAGADLKAAYLQMASGLLAYWAGYAFQLAIDDTNVSYFYPRAIQKHGYLTPGSWNNYGYYLRDRARPEAVRCFTNAIQLDPRCQAAYLNRAYVYSKMQNDSAPGDNTYRDLALTDAAIATALEPDKAHAYFSIAMIHWVHNHTADRKPVIIDNLREALDHGYDKSKLLNRSGFGPELTDPLQGYEPSSLDQRGPNAHTAPLLIPPPNWFPEMQIK